MIIKKYPIVIQDELKDCGVTCIQMILKYYNGYVNKNKLLDLTKTNKSGTTAYNLKETLIKLGFDCKGVKCKIEETKNKIVLPAIANVTINNSLKHFVVIYEINYNKKYLIIGDPASKIKKISFDEFSKIFNQVLLIFYPIKNIPIDKKYNLNQILKLLYKPHKYLFLNVIFLSIFVTFFSIITSFYTKYMINYINYNSKERLIFIFLIFLIIYIFKIISNYFRNKLFALINQKIDLELTLDVFNKIIDLPYQYYQNRTTGDIVSRISDLEKLRDILSKFALSIFIDLPLAILSLIILYIINKKLFLIGLIIIILYFFIFLIFRSHFEQSVNTIQEKRSDEVSYMVESISGFETIKGLNISNSVKDKFEKRYVKYLKEVNKYQNLFFTSNLFKDLVNDIGSITIILFGCILVIENKISVADLITFLSLLNYFLEPIKSILNLDGDIKSLKNALKRILNIIDYKEENRGIYDKFIPGEIIFKNLSFSYNDRDYILKNINLKIDDKSKCMVIGASGSGKSTLFKILAKIHSIENNQVYINDIDLNDFKYVNNNILYLGQNEILFNDTLYNNLIFDNSNSSKLNEIKKICKLDDIIDNNLGFNMLIEENGFNLSGGQKQRIFLARALLKKFDILIIDEGLNQVDVEMEREILKNVFEYYKDKTIIFISHRTNNLSLFDSLIEFNNGIIKRSNKIG